MKHKHYSKKHAVHIDKHSGLIKQLYSQHSGYIPWEKHITVLLFASFGLFAFFSYDNYQTNKQFTIEINSQLHTSDFQMNESTRLARNNYFESYPEYREDALKNGISIGTHIYINPPLSNIYNGITNGLDIINKNPVEKFISTHLFQSLYI
ncbi:MAG: hypothetical protein U9Q15_00880 [Patescibacteria group bacterium]|nr:hypothetical protein [Patescibacteria group bacterium]